MADIKTEVAVGWPEVPAVELCVRLLDFMSNLPEDQLRMLTFRELTRAVGQTNVSSELLTAIAILKEVSVLDARALFVDYDEREYELEVEELADAQLTGELVHPHTGEMVRDFEKYVVPFFTPTSRFMTEAHSG